MNLCRRFCVVLLISIFVGGCYEDVVEIKLNPDGSGSIKQRCVLSEQLMTSSESDNESVSASNVPETTKEALVKKIGTAFNVTSIKQEDTPDGDRIIELEGTFDTPEQFFLSEYCQDQLNLNISLADEGKAAIYCDLSQSGDTGPDMTQLYGLAKGLLMKRTIQLPADIEESNGEVDKSIRSVSWAADLRNKEALKKTKAFVEGNDNGKGFAIFDSSKLKFSLPLKSEDIPDESEITETNETPVISSDYSAVAAKVSWVSANKKIPSDGSGKYEISNLELGIDLTWDENSCPISCRKPVLISINDDLGNNLVSDSTISKSLKNIHSSDKRNMKKELTVKAETPNKNAKSIKQIEGYVEAIINIEQEKVKLDNLQNLIGKESSGNKILDSLNFKIESIKEKDIKIEIDGGKDTIVSIVMLKDDGTEIKRTSYSGWENSYTYSFREDISKINKCEMELVVKENIIKVPFSLEEIPLP